MERAVELFRNTLSWLRNNYSGFRFCVERDVVWTVQIHLLRVIADRHLPYRVYNDYPMLPGRRRSLSADLAILDSRDRVQVAAEFKYEPSHERSGDDLWPTKFMPSVVFWGEDGVQKDIDRIRAFVAQGKARVAYAVFIDEGGYFCRRAPHPGSKWINWGQGVWVLYSRVEEGSQPL